MPILILSYNMYVYTYIYIFFLTPLSIARIVSILFSMSYVRCHQLMCFKSYLYLSNDSRIFHLIKVFFYCFQTCINAKIANNNPFENNIFLRDIHDQEYNYAATALLCFSAYSDNISLIKKKSNKYIQLIGDTFSEQTSLTFNNLLDIFDTSSSVLVFNHQVYIITFVHMFFV